MSEQSLFTPYTLGSISLKNKVVMAPLTRSRASADNVQSELNATYYGQRAGAGLIITEGTSPSPNGVGYPRIPGIYNEDQIKGWKSVTDAVHTNGGKIVIQLMHTGRVTHIANLPEGAEVVAPSPLLLEGEMYTDKEGMQPHSQPREMNNEDIQLAINEYVRGAENAMKAGFDGVEMHAANGYLLEQFLNPITNQRTDEYGGSPANRVKFAVEATKKVIEAVGEGKVGMRISPYGAFNGMGPFDSLEETYTLLAKEMSEIGLIYIHIVDHSAMGAPEVPGRIKDIIRENFKGSIMLSGGYDRDRAQKDLDDGKGHLVAFGRPFIANPDLVERMKSNAKINEPNPDTFYTTGPEGYIDYPTLEEETAGS